MDEKSLDEREKGSATRICNESDRRSCLELTRSSFRKLLTTNDEMQMKSKAANAKREEKSSIESKDCRGGRVPISEDGYPSICGDWRLTG